ncbi:MAG: hypothetical protein EBR71_05590 [Planctomycetes bacterium]|nr:hypothetical protein [Planctomycetota bacterium]
MMIQENELWWSPSQGFSDKRGVGADWECLDDAIKVCCLTGTEMVRTKLALGSAKNDDELPALLNCGQNAQIKIDQQPAVAAAPKTATNKPADLRPAAERVRNALSFSGMVNFDRQLIEGKPRRQETDEDIAKRVNRELNKVLRTLPDAQSVTSNQDFAADLEETKNLLREAIRHASKKAFPASAERLRAAQAVMRELGGTY